MGSVDYMPLSKSRQVKMIQSEKYKFMYPSDISSIPHCLLVRYHILPLSLREHKSIIVWSMDYEPDSNEKVKCEITF